MATVTEKIDWPMVDEDDEGNEYFECPYCEGSGIACKGATMDFGDDETPMIAQIEPDWPCGLCDEQGVIKVGSENHFFAIKNTILEITQNTFGQEIIDSLPQKEFKEFYTHFEEAFRILKPQFLKNQ